MKKTAGILFVIFACCILTACAVKTYPRQVTAKEKADTNVAWAVDTSLARYVSGFYKPVFGLDKQVVTVDYDFYLDPAFRQNPRSFYPAPGAPPEFEAREKLDETDQVEIFLLKWKSSYSPMNPAFAPLYDSYPETHSAYGVYVKSRSPNRAAMIISHGWTGPDIRKYYKTIGMDLYAAMGVDTILLQQPYHGLRMPASSNFSGELFFSGEVSRINEAFCQTVTDLRTILLWLRESYEVVGAMGGSLGGITTLLAAAVEDDLDFAVAWVPPSAIGRIPFDSALAHFVARGMTESGLDRQKVDEILYVSNPANFQPAIPRENIMIIAGMGDNFVPTDQPMMVWEAWGKPEIVWFAGGHALNFQNSYCKQVESEFIRAHLP